MPRLALSVNHRLPCAQVVDPAPAGTVSTPAAEPADIKFDDAQQKKLNDLLAAERKTTADKVRADLATEAAAAKTKAEADAERKRQEEAGEFDKVRQSIEQERDTAARERDSLKAENEFYAKHFEAKYAEDVKAIPDAIWDVLKPADDASLPVRIEQLAKAKKLAEGFGTQATAGGGSRPTPKPGPVQSDIEKAKDKMRGNISI